MPALSSLPPPLQLVSRLSETLTGTPTGSPLNPTALPFADADPVLQLPTPAPPPQLLPDYHSQKPSPFAMAPPFSGSTHQHVYHGSHVLSQHAEHDSQSQQPQYGSLMLRPCSAPIPTIRRSLSCGPAGLAYTGTLPAVDRRRARPSDLERQGKLEAALDAQLIMQRKLHDQLEVCIP